MARTLEEILKDLKDAEKEYSEKCKKYGIEEKGKKKKEEIQVDENGNPIVIEEEKTQESTDNQETKAD